MANSQPRVQILVAAHKPYAMPKSEIFLPIQVGKKLAKSVIDDFIGDDTGNNISGKNPVFCELTALYWAWKNLDSDYIGLAHYRRHFKNRHGANLTGIKLPGYSHVNQKIISSLNHVASSEQIQSVLKDTDVILPKKRRYYIENLYDHYCKTMNPEPLHKVRDIIAQRCPEYLIEFDLLKHRRSMHAFNMLIMKREILDQYCSWLFPILFELEKQINTTDWSDFEKRYIGRISERLLDIWLNTNHISYIEIPVIDIEPVNWIKKGTGFLQAKFFGRKYEKSW